MTRNHTAQAWKRILGSRLSATSYPRSSVCICGSKSSADRVCARIKVAAYILTIAVQQVTAGEAPPDVARLRVDAAVAERDQGPAAAAAAYERLFSADPAARPVLLPRLVSLQLAAGETNRAIASARAYMGVTPDPPLYLAGVYAVAGQPKEALDLLNAAYAEATGRRRVMIDWQRAGVLVTLGQPEQARQRLEAAVMTATNTVDYAPAVRRLEAFDSASPDAKR